MNIHRNSLNSIMNEIQWSMVQMKVKILSHIQCKVWWYTYYKVNNNNDSILSFCACYYKTVLLLLTTY